MVRIVRMIRALAHLLYRRSWGPFVETAEVTSFDYAFTVSWSQGGEDLALASIFSSKSDGTYLDIGAHHPSRFSVTRHLYQRGWHGVNVEANKDLIKKFEQVRTRDINLCCAIGLKEFYEFTIFQEPAISTVNLEWKSKFLFENNSIDRIETVSGRRLRSIYDEFFPEKPVDLLTIDAEGADLEVLQSMDFFNLPNERFPEFALLETAPPVSNSLVTPSVKFLIEQGYELILVLPFSSILKRVVVR